MNYTRATREVSQNALLLQLSIARIAQAARIRTGREIFIRERRLRATELALDGLPEYMRCDIGWPDLYERQVGECNQLKKSRS